MVSIDHCLFHFISLWCWQVLAFTRNSSSSFKGKKLVNPRQSVNKKMKKKFLKKIFFFFLSKTINDIINNGQFNIWYLLITVFFILYLYGADRFWLWLEILQVLFWGEKIGESPSVSQQKNEKESLKNNLFFLSFKNNQWHY